jgi:sodium-dependent phosphate cotransporter
LKLEKLQNQSEGHQELSGIDILKKTLTFIAVLFIFLVALKAMGTSFKSFKGLAENILNLTDNPFKALFVGMLATAIIQSSSTTTSMIVTMVAATTLVFNDQYEAGLIDAVQLKSSIKQTIEGAVFLIFGANIGTSVTSSILAFGHIGKKKEYRKAVAAATVHDFFNILVVTILFPLEYFFHVLTRIATVLADFFYMGDGDKLDTKSFSVMKYTIKPVVGVMKDAARAINKEYYGYILLAFSLLLLFFALRALTKVLEAYVKDRAKETLNKVMFKSPKRALGLGVVMTVMVQSSSVTTSLMVPLIASGKMPLKRAFPFLMGANIGTTVTAMIAALSGNIYGLIIAFVHVLFNLIGVSLFFPFKQVREIPIKMAKWLGRMSYSHRWVGIAYVAFTFFALPGLLYIFTS